MESKKKSQISINSEDFQGILESIGYQLIDCGDHWRTQALYRDGDNKTAVKVYKNTGVWMDFVENKGSMPFEALVRLTVKDEKQIKELLGGRTIETSELYCPKEKIEMEKIYPDSSLDKLFPNYHFYEQRKISKETQQAFQAGLAGVGKMYRRMVFPIYNEHKQIIGFSGRKVDSNNNYSKWKHIGRRNNWVYPAFNEKTCVDQEITTKQEVVLVESIGDAMALYDQGIKNVLVIFGLSVNNNIVNYLNSKSIRHIYISTNNDKASEENRGFIAALKSFLKLSKYFDLDRLTVKFPPKLYNDFGDAHLEGYDLNSWLSKDIDKAAQIKYILDFAKNNPSCFTKKEIKTALILSDA
jgi:hypothetical protein|tara:strand:+ start:2232 stop:3296 length:1065 start_codon:yes stop_codon:yes gene_type:complete